MSFGNWLDSWEIEGSAVQMRMFPCDFYAEKAGGSADIAERMVIREVEFISQSFKVDQRQASHGPHELLELGKVFVQFLEEPLHPMLGFILRTTGAQSFRQIMSELE